MDSSRLTIVITKLSRWTYFQWFILGFYELADKNEIELKFEVSFWEKLTLFPFFNLFSSRIGKFRSKDSYLFEGYLLSKGQKRYFCIDSADSPYLFSGAALKRVDAYFKMQCPKYFEKDGFRLGDVLIPYSDHQHVIDGLPLTAISPRKLCNEAFSEQNKIKPLLSGVRRLAKGNSFRKLKAGYQNLIESRKTETQYKAMCYFGNSMGPKASENALFPDFDSESNLLSYFQDKISHPNLKRHRIYSILKKLGSNFDARLICDGYADSNGQINADKSIPIELFSHHVAKFQYNINVSGYRMSIPARFMDSFITGTAVATDNLKVKWYLPFDKEVVEIGEMGYLLDSDVEYDKIEEQISTLPKVDREEIISIYESKWSPIKCAEYIVKTLTESQ